MRTLIICRASTVIGLGHLVRAKTFTEKLLQAHFDITVDFAMVGESGLQKLLKNLRCKIYSMENEDQLMSIGDTYDVIFFDSIEFDANIVLHLKRISHLTVSLSPVFNQMHLVDLMFTRTKYAADEGQPSSLKIYGGMQYTLVQPDCFKIDTNYFISNLSKSNFHIGISMGGGDAANKSLLVVSALQTLPIPATIWVMLGEGYRHSYDKFIAAVEKDSEHEIILAKTNKSMWNVLNNCSLLITTSGITAYEAVYAGLPSITYFDTASQFYLLRELIERNVAINGGLFNSESLDRLSGVINEAYNNKGRLIEMHKNSLTLIDNTAAFKIVDVIHSELRKREKVFLKPYRPL